MSHYDDPWYDDDDSIAEFPLGPFDLDDADELASTLLGKPLTGICPFCNEVAWLTDDEYVCDTCGPLDDEEVGD